jgi:hypothetical protein
MQEDVKVIAAPPVPPHEDVDDLIFRWEPNEWLVSER